MLVRIHLTGVIKTNSMKKRPILRWAWKDRIGFAGRREARHFREKIQHKLGYEGRNEREAYGNNEETDIISGIDKFGEVIGYTL